MDMMTDSEVEAVIGHEMGTCTLGRVKKGMVQVALGTNAVRVAAAGRRCRRPVTQKSQQRLGGENWGELAVLSASEVEADDYSYDLLRKRAVSVGRTRYQLLKTGKTGSGSISSMFDDHPASAARAQHVRDRMARTGSEITPGSAGWRRERLIRPYKSISCRPEGLSAVPSGKTNLLALLRRTDIGISNASVAAARGGDL